MAHVEQCGKVAVMRDSGGKSFITSGRLCNDTKVIAVQFAIQWRTKPSWNLAEPPKDFHRSLSCEGQGIIRLGEIAREETLH